MAQCCQTADTQREYWQYCSQNLCTGTWNQPTGRSNKCFSSISQGAATFNDFVSFPLFSIPSAPTRHLLLPFLRLLWSFRKGLYRSVFNGRLSERYRGIYQFFHRLAESLASRRLDTTSNRHKYTSIHLHTYIIHILYITTRISSSKLNTPNHTHTYIHTRTHRYANTHRDKHTFTHTSSHT